MSIFSSLQPEAHLNHNVFDTSKRDIFSLKSGMITPFYVQHTIPNSTYDLSFADQIEVNPMQKANFARMSQQVEFYFVPYSQIWRWFESFYYQRFDTTRNPSNVNTRYIPKNVPTFNHYEVVTRLFYAYCVLHYLNDFCLINSSNSNLHYSAHGDDLFTVFEYVHNIVHHDCDNGNVVSFLDDTVDVHGRYAIEDVLRNFDLLGYGNFLPHFKSIYSMCFISTFKPNSTFEEAFSVFIEIMRGKDLEQPTDLQEFVQYTDDFLSNLLDVAESDFSGTVLEYMHTYQVSAWPILAYLKIFSDNFRSVQYDNTNYSFYYNLDYLLPNSQGVVGSIASDRIIFALIPRYRLYRRDILTGTYPNAQFGDVSVASINNPVQIKSGSFQNPPVSPLVSSSGFLGSVSSSGSLNTSWSINTGISALAIRQAEALQRWKEKNLRAGNRLINQQRAMFGDTSYYLQDDYSHYIGGVNSDILVNSVAATAETGDYNVGEKAANAASASSGNIGKFHCKDFGVIIGVMYILPRAEYENLGLDPHVTKVEPFDFFNANFQNLGLAPVTTVLADVSQSPSVVGYSSRFWEYKTALDHVHGEFTRGGAFTDYVTPRDVEDFNQQLRLSSLYVSPNDVDRIFYVSADYCQDTDQFKVNAYTMSKSVLPMSVTGLPY